MRCAFSRGVRSAECECGGCWTSRREIRAALTALVEDGNENALRVTKVTLPSSSGSMLKSFQLLSKSD